MIFPARFILGQEFGQVLNETTWTGGDAAMISDSQPARSERIRDLEAMLTVERCPSDHIDVLNEAAATLSSSDATKARQYATDALALAETEGHESGVASAHFALASALWNLGLFEGAILHANEALERFERLGDKSNLGRTHLLLGSVAIRRSDLVQAIGSTVEGLGLLEGCGDDHGAALAHNLLSVIYSEREQYEQALEHRLHSAEIHEREGDRYRLAVVRINIGNIYLCLEDLERAIDEYEKAVVVLQEDEPAGFPISSAYHNLGEICRLRGEPDKARSYFENARSLRHRTGNAAGVVFTTVALGELCTEQSDLAEAEVLLTDARDMSADLGLLKHERTATLGLSQLAEKRGDPARALELHKRATELQSRLSDQIQSRQVAEMQTRYETERKAREAELYQLRFVELEREVVRREQAERALIQSQKLESLGLMAGGVSHDFNNMLLCIFGYLDAARDVLDADHEAQSFLDLADQAGRRAADLARQMLAYAGRSRYVMEPRDISATIEECRQLLAGTAGNVDLDLALAGALPRIEADSAQIQHLVTNLVLNAVECGATTVRVATGQCELGEDEFRFREYTGDVLKRGSYVRLTVTDNGPGIEADVVSRIFDPFYSTKPDRRGLGLAAVLGITRSHKGGVSVGCDGDTQFEIVFPVLADDSSLITSAPTKSESDAGASIETEATILIIDDEPEIRTLVTMILERANFVVLAAGERKSGIDLYRDHVDDVSVVLLDLTMPGMSAIQTYRALCAIEPEVRVILTSGHDREQSLAEFPSDFPFIAKPYRANELRDFIRQVLSEPS